MDTQTNYILPLLHHVHHTPNGHEVHHCGGEHRQIDPSLSYTIHHCGCGLHSIDAREALGHATDKNAQPIDLTIHFVEPCPEGGWHLESGMVKE